MLLRMRALTEGARALLYYTCGMVDRAALGIEGVQARADCLVPMLKAWATDVGCEVASLGLQIHGGMGFVEETGAAQHYRDARILPIYEGTNGIQAIDLVTRKLPLDGGKLMEAYIGELWQTCEEVRASNRPEFGRMGQRLTEAVTALAEASKWMGTQLAKNPDAALASATPYLRIFGLAAGGVYLAKGALAAVREGNAASPYVGLARYFAENHATAAEGLKQSVVDGAESTLSFALGA
jgi:hypothetical protein